MGCMCSRQGGQEANPRCPRLRGYVVASLPGGAALVRPAVVMGAERPWFPPRRRPAPDHGGTARNGVEPYQYLRRSCRNAETR